MLICSVRGCGLPLTREDRRVVCPRAHSFDIARSGYINLLQPQDRRSKDPGDSAEVVAARRRLHDRGVTAHLLVAVQEMLGLTERDSVVEAGCGDGFYVGSLARETACKARGVDISTPAIEAAAKRYKTCEWVVANADRFIPCADGDVSAVISIAARMNTGEFRRILRPDGKLLVGVPAPDDLIELRGKGRDDRLERTTATFGAEFEVIMKRRVTATAMLDVQGVLDVLLSIYRPLRSEAVKEMRVTFSLDMILFAPLCLGND